MSERIPQEVGSRRKRLGPTKAIGLSDGPEDQQVPWMPAQFPFETIAIGLIRRHFRNEMTLE